MKANKNGDIFFISFQKILSILRYSSLSKIKRFYDVIQFSNVKPINNYLNISGTVLPFWIKLGQIVGHVMKTFFLKFQKNDVDWYFFIVIVIGYFNLDNWWKF